MPESAISVLHLSTFDRQGGAARAAFRLHQALRELGIRSQMRVQVKSTDDPSVSGPANQVARLKDGLIAIVDRVPQAFYSGRASVPFDSQWVGSYSASAAVRMRPDIIHLHWVAGGFLRIESLRKLARPLVWTLCDMWPFTGGCHVSGDCDHYRTKCGSCWQLGSAFSHDLAYWVWRRKRRAWRALDLNLVAPSSWIAESARSSSLFRNRPVRVIPNGIDTSIFKPLDKAWARTCFGIDKDQYVILFGANDPIKDANKGFDILLAAMRIVSGQLGAAPHELVIFGCAAAKQPPELDSRVRYLGVLADEVSLAVAYNVADVMVVPSRQESFCQTAAEALACGTPVVAFDGTGLRDVVDNGVSGYLAPPYQAEDLAAGIVRILTSGGMERLSRQARQRALERFAVEKVARSYADLYEEVLNR